ncbi:hypothetical protein HTG_10690 [Natrinema mahii]|nr:hypothetical protein HTG_10690 [Natrinema mahii]
MTDVFVAGPIDFRDVDTIVDYRVRIYTLLDKHGFSPVDQYVDVFEQLATVNSDRTNPLQALDFEKLQSEPFLDAITAAIEDTSATAVLESPEIVPEHTPDSIVSSIVERDLELVEQADVFLAYLPEPSCGTMAELLHARRHGIPTVVVSEPAPHFVQYYADEIHPTIDDAVATLDAFDSGS